MEKFLIISGIVIAILWINDLITDHYQYKIEMKRLEQSNESKKSSKIESS